MTEFQAGQSAQDAHCALKSSLATMKKAKQSAVLWFGEIMARKLYREFGYSSINQYAKVELGFSSSRTGDFLNLCRKLEALPQVKAEVATGKLDYTKARVLVGVADATNEAAWLEVARGTSRRELEREVKQAKAAAIEKNAGQTSLLPAAPSRPAAVVPVRVSFEMSPAQFARYEALMAKVRRTGDVSADKVEALLEVLAAFGSESATRVDVLPAQIHVHQCPDCERATVQTSRGELDVGEAELERLQCDCRLNEPGKRNTRAIPPATLREVLARDRHRCQRPGCGHTQFLEVHHKVLRSQGGSNDEDNLVTLCSACHRLLHEKGTSLVRSPQPIYTTRTPSAPHR